VAKQAFVAARSSVSSGATSIWWNVRCASSDRNGVATSRFRRAGGCDTCRWPHD